MRKSFVVALVVAAALLLSGCDKNLGGTSPSPAPPANPPLSISTSPSGFGLHDATVFLFTASGGRDIVTYRWDFGDGDTKSGSEAAAAHIYKRSGTFNIQLQATDSRSNQTTALLTGLTIGSVAGTWDLTLVPSPNYPWLVCTKLTARLFQFGDDISGTITPTACSIQINPCRPNEPLMGYSAPILFGKVSDPRKAHFGNESFYAVYNSDCVDTYFEMELSPDLNTMSGTCFGKCSSVTAVRR